jgi:4-hydroxyphenylpyruvate dioxygenase-like putative hemolysin
MTKHSVSVSSTPLPPLHDFTPPRGTDPVAIDGFDHIHIFADSAKQSAFLLTNQFGFRPWAYRGPETGWRDSVSLVVKQGDVFVQLSCPLLSSSPIAEHVKRHGFSVKDVAFRVPNAESCYYEALKRGAVGISEPTK